ncbi:uncharacterized protein LOC135927119 [Gordionus sp. m RMFG-2023]|uniref:uncharacterized protein LOC135927119 n=1 Tax=Gordionus sp. m RMFG-2023 TaxID=3053472 RepID=UPI0031FD8991
MKNIYDASTSCVRTTVGDSKLFRVEIGLYQGSALSTFLFIIIMDTMAGDIQKPSPWCMLYADDIVLCEETKEKVFEEAEKWSKRLAGYGLKFNNRKTVYMEMNVTGTPSLDDQLKYRKVNRFTYLGSILQHEGGCEKEVNARIQKGWHKWRRISGVMCDKRCQYG